MVQEQLHKQFLKNRCLVLACFALLCSCGFNLHAFEQTVIDVPAGASKEADARAGRLVTDVSFLRRIVTPQCGPRPLPAGGLQVAFDVCVNQTGYAPDAVKEFFIRNPPSDVFVVQTINPSVRYHAVLTGRLERVEGVHGLWKGDFTRISKPADYRILVGGDLGNGDVILPKDFRGSACHSFVIKDDPQAVAERFIFQFFTWQRCGSKKGWAGLCHQDLVPLYGTGRMLDMRGGYHQSGDLRCWADGVSLSIYALLRWSELRHPEWDDGCVDEELRWGLDYFLKLVGPEGYAYDCQFVPIGWGPRDYYPQPAPLGAQMNIAALMARASRRYAVSDPPYAKRLLSTAERLWKDIENNPAYDRIYKEMVSNLPGGCQPQSFYLQTRRTSANGYSGRAFVALELLRATGDAKYAELARRYGDRLQELQIAEGPLSGAYLNEPEAREVGYHDCLYGVMLHAHTVMLELFDAFGEAKYRDAYLRSCDLVVRMLEADRYWSVPTLNVKAPELIVQGVTFREALNLLTEDPPYVNNVRKGTSATFAEKYTIMLTEAMRRFGRKDYASCAARMRDWIYGANPGCASYVTGLGYNSRRRNVFGQFFPSTPPIPGGVCHVLNGEYDLPGAGMALWAIGVESGGVGATDPRYALEPLADTAARMEDTAGCLRTGHCE